MVVVWNTNTTTKKGAGGALHYCRKRSSSPKANEWLGQQSAGSAALFYTLFIQQKRRVCAEVIQQVKLLIRRITTLGKETDISAANCGYKQQSLCVLIGPVFHPSAAKDYHCAASR